MTDVRIHELPEATSWNGFFPQDKPSGPTECVSVATVEAKLVSDGFVKTAVLVAGYQPLENQRLRTTDNVNFNKLQIAGVDRITTAGGFVGTSLQISGATANKLARFDASKNLVSYDLVAADIPVTIASNTTGSAAKWTTGRTLTIGATGKSVDGSANVSWSLAEIGAAPAHSVASNTVLKSNGAGGFAASTATDDGTTFATTGRLGWGGGILRDYTGNASIGALYGSSAMPPSTQNHSFAWMKNGTSAALNGSTQVSLQISGADKLTAFSGYIQPSVPLYMPDLNLWGTARSGDGGRWMHYMGGGTGGISTGTATALIDRYQYAGFSGFVVGSKEFYGNTISHDGTAAQYSIIAGKSGGVISFHVGDPVLVGSNYRAPKVGSWTNSGLAITGTLSASSLAGTGTRMVTAAADGTLGSTSTPTLDDFQTSTFRGVSYDEGASSTISSYNPMVCRLTGGGGQAMILAPGARIGELRIIIPNAASKSVTLSQMNTFLSGDLYAGAGRMVLAVWAGTGWAVGQL